LETGNQISPSQWQRWMENPIEIGASELPQLLDLNQQFPWFSTPKKFLAWVAKKENLPAFNYWKQQAAISSANNHDLFELIQNTAIPDHRSMDNLRSEWVDTKEESEGNSPSIAFTLDANLSDIANQIFLEEATDKDSVVIEDDWISIPLIEPELPGEDITQTNALSETEVRELTQESIDLGELGHEIMNKAISSSIEIEVGEIESVESTTVVADKSPSIVWEDDFLNFIADTLGEQAEPSPDSKAETIQIEKKEEDIITQFIKKEPQITRGKVMDYDVGNMAKESLEEDYNLVTETMAKLYVKQGKMEKARKAYKKLIELFPEKSIYFATQLKNLNKKNQ
jgi:hypothetical protein